MSSEGAPHDLSVIDQDPLNVLTQSEHGGKNVRNMYNI